MFFAFALITMYVTVQTVYPALGIEEDKYYINWDTLQNVHNIMEGSIHSEMQHNTVILLLHEITFSLKTATMSIREVLQKSSMLPQVLMNVHVEEDLHVFHMMCYHWAYNLKWNVPTEWTIHVHSSFAVNLTIWKAYVPYSGGCKVSTIAFYNLSPFNNFSSIWSWCGHTIKDTVYSKRNKAGLEFWCDTDMLPQPLMLNASYQIMQPGAAYVFSRTFRPSGWIIPLLPNIIYYMYGQLTFSWVLFNSYGGSTKTLTIPEIHVRLFTCVQGSLMVYPGMLTLYQTRWTAKPLMTVQCNTMTQHRLKMSSHMYATMVITILALDKHARLFVRFRPFHINPSRNPNLFMMSKDFTESKTVSYDSVPIINSRGASKISIAVINWPVILTLRYFKRMITKPNIHYSQLSTLDVTRNTPDGET